MAEKRSREVTSLQSIGSKSFQIISKVNSLYFRTEVNHTNSIPSLLEWQFAAEIVTSPHLQGRKSYS